MEDMARLALLEQSVKDPKTFSSLLLELLHSINNILDDPDDYDLRIIDSDIVKSAYKYDSFTEYLKYIGFEQVENDYEFPIEQTLTKLRLAQAGLERKLYFCLGHVPYKKNDMVKKLNLPIASKPKLTPANVLTTRNEFLKKIQTLFNYMIQYEDEELQDYARSVIPVLTLQMLAVDRMREHQRNIKLKQTTEVDLPFDTALLMELLVWFKYKFFRWFDKPQCEACGGDTVMLRNEMITTESETCRLELYRCTNCNSEVGFPRYNDPRVLLKTRRGRCGEWANAFTLLCRSLNYETRNVYDTTDHVWCEVYDNESNCWVHVDPCEGKLDAPLIYSHGWKKSISYVIATSWDDLQDVTWRYTTDHKAVRARRNLCSEEELISTILTLRAHRHSQLSDARRKYLARRGLKELVQLMVEKKPSDYEATGRLSGSKAWRRERCEIGVNSGKIFLFKQPGSYTVRYFAGSDKYRTECDGCEIEALDSWDGGVFNSQNVFRKVENDWKKAYLAREEGESFGSVSWKLMVDGERVEFYTLSVRSISALYENGKIDWTVQFNGEKPMRVNFGENDTPVKFEQSFKEVVITAELSGGNGDLAWQHAQLFRQNLSDAACAFEVSVQVRKLD